MHKRVALQIGIRVGVVAVILGILLALNVETETPEPLQSQIPDSTNTALAIVRLYAQTDGNWAEEDRTALARLYQRQDEIAIAQILNPAILTNAQQMTRLEQDILTNNTDAARQALRTQLESDPTDPQRNLMLALLLLPDPEANFFLQRVAFSNSPLQSLAASLQGVIAVGRYSLRDLGIRLMEANQWVLAEWAFSQHITENSLDAAVFAYRGYVRDQRGADGLADIQHAVSLEPTNPLSFFMLGLHHRQTEAYDQSLEAFNTAFLYNPDNPALAAEIAQAYVLSNDLTQAEEWYQVALGLAPEDVRFVGLLAAFYADEVGSDSPDSAGYVFTQNAAARYRDDPLIVTSWGRVLFHAQELDAAQSVLATALEIAPDDPRALFFWAELLERQGNREAAISAYFRVTQTENPYAESAQQAIQRLAP